ncbi:MAG: YdeI/OmpD-associated family protein [Opitutaceae bacterium]
MTYMEAVDEALCFGWIDGIVRKIGADSYSHRFTARRTGSIWSNLNVAHVDRLTQAGKMHAAGVAAFAARTAKKTGVYAFEQREPQKLPAAYLRRFKANKTAWTFFSSQAPSYQRLIIHKVVTSKQAATKARWLDRAIEASAGGQRL